MIRPLTGQALIRLLPPDEKTDGGLFLPDIAQDSPQGEKAKPRRGLVIAIGPWRTTKDGFAILPDFQPGDTVLLSEYLGTKLTRAIGESLRLCRVDDVLAVLTNGSKGPDFTQ
jgi:chaperonin GroES